MKHRFRLNQVEVEIAGRQVGKEWEPVVVDHQLGDFYLSEDDQIEMRDVKLLEALRPQPSDGGWKHVTLAQVAEFFNRPVLRR